MKDAIRIEEDHGQRLLAAVGWPFGDFRVRLLTEDALAKLSDDDFHLYRKRVRELVRQVGANCHLQDGDTIRAYDYLRNAVRREDVRRAT
jgi:hypothetical protein